MLVSKTKVLGLNILNFFQGVSKQTKEDFDLAVVQANISFLIMCGHSSSIHPVDFSPLLTFLPSSPSKLGKWWFYMSRHLFRACRMDSLFGRAPQLGWQCCAMPFVNIRNILAFDRVAAPLERTTEMSHCRAWVPSSAFWVLVIVLLSCKHLKMKQK